MNLKLKLVSAFLTIAVLLIIAGLMSIKGFEDVQVSIQNILDENYRTILAAHNMLEALEREDSAILLLMHGSWEKGRDQIETADSRFLAAFEMAKDNITIEGEAQQLETLERLYDDYRETWKRPIVNTDKEGDLLWYQNVAHERFQKVKHQIRYVAEMNDKSLYSTASSLEDIAERAIKPGIIAIITTLILIAIFSYFISALVVSPIIRMTIRVRAFREGGDLNKLDIHTGDEIQELAEEIRLLVKRIPGKR